jgi:hypothetical protein
VFPGKIRIAYRKGELLIFRPLDDALILSASTKKPGSAADLCNVLSSVVPVLFETPLAGFSVPGTGKKFLFESGK